MSELKMDKATLERVDGIITNSNERLIAVHGLLDNLLGKCFEQTCDGVLSSVRATRSEKKQQDAASAWMEQYYDLVSSAIFAAVRLVEDSKCELEQFAMELFLSREKAATQESLEYLERLTEEEK